MSSPHHLPSPIEIPERTTSDLDAVLEDGVKVFVEVRRSAIHGKPHKKSDQFTISISKWCERAYAATGDLPIRTALEQLHSTIDTLSTTGIEVRLKEILKALYTLRALNELEGQIEAAFKQPES